VPIHPAMKNRSASTPSISLGIRVAAFTSLCVLSGVLLTALALEVRGRAEARSAAGESLRRARTVAADRLARQGESLERLAATVARDPKFFALLTMKPSERTGAFRHALEGVVREFQRDAASEVFDVTDSTGVTLAASPRAAAPENDRAASPLIKSALEGRVASGYRVEGGRLYRVAVVPVAAEDGEVVGTLTLGAPLDDEFVNAIRAAAGTDAILVANTAGRPDGAPGGTAHPLATTLTDAATRSLLGTIGPAPSRARRWTERDAKEVSMAKSPGLAVDVSLQGALEGGAPRLIVATPLAIGSDVAAAREVLLGAGALSAAIAFVFGWVTGGRMGRRLRKLAVAAREARQGNHEAPLPDEEPDETGLLTAEFEAMRTAQREEIDRMAEMDRMKTEFIAVTAQDILTPAEEIETVATALTMGRAGELPPEAMKRLRLIRVNAGNLARLASDIGGARVASRLAVDSAAATDAEPKGRVNARDGREEAESAPAEPDAAVEVVATDEEFHAVSVPASVPAPVPASVPAPVPDALDVAALIEELAVEVLPEAARRGLEVDLSVDPDLIHPSLERAAIEPSLRSYIEEVLAGAPPRTTIVMKGRRLPDAIEIHLDGGAAPFERRLPIASDYLAVK
jgi:signal transduction histidine kinase